jgi:transcriptional regulator with XRE-family HTH domain
MSTNVARPIFNNRLRRYRKARGLSQVDTARILGLKSAARISRWEQGHCLPTMVNLFKLAALYRTLVDALYIDQLRAIRDEIRARESRLLEHNGHAQ